MWGGREEMGVESLSFTMGVKSCSLGDPSIHFLALFKVQKMQVYSLKDEMVYNFVNSIFIQ